VATPAQAALRPQSLQRRLTLLVIGLMALVWLGTAVMTWRDVRHELDELLDSHLAQAAALLVVQQAAEVDEERSRDAPLLHRYATQVAFQVWHEGQLVQRSANAPSTPMLAAAHEFNSGFRTVPMGDVEWRVFATHGAENDVHVYVGERVASRQSILFAVMRSTLGPLALALPLLALAAWWAVRQGMRPMRRLGQTLATRDPRTLAPVVSADAPAEMQPMLGALNGLFERIGAMMEAERRFTADAAHELRTPIAAIRTQAQVALGETDDARRRHALQATLQGCDRATRLVEQLLTLSRLEAAPAADADTARIAETPPVDLAALARRVLGDSAQAAVARRQTLELDTGDALTIHASETLLTALLRNLVDNALRYSPEGATVRVSVQRDGMALRLRVQDSGPGLTDADLQRLGERFFRVLGSGQSGSGLGWSIVRRIATAQGATAEASRSPELGGLRVDVRWPAA
jgi:two-component system, OmpR family, sensor histidine kinase QseC